MIYDWLSRNARLIIASVIILAIVVTLVMCRGDGASDQARQTNRSGEAINAAASEAIDTIGQRVATEQTIDEATAKGVAAIQGAQDPEAVRSAVLDAVCKQRSHRNDPACAQ